LDATRVNELRDGKWHPTTIFDGDTGLLRLGRLIECAALAEIRELQGMNQIVYPVREEADEEEEYCFIVDATGRALDTSEIVYALQDMVDLRRKLALARSEKTEPVAWRFRAKAGGAWTVSQSPIFRDQWPEEFYEIQPLYDVPSSHSAVAEKAPTISAGGAYEVKLYGTLGYVGTVAGITVHADPDVPEHTVIIKDEHGRELGRIVNVGLY